MAILKLILSVEEITREGMSLDEITSVLKY
jgi:hypothetical protein